MTLPLKNQLCFAYLAEDGTIAALVLNEIVSKNDEDVDPCVGLEDPQSKIVMQFFMEQAKKVDVFSKFGVDRIFDIKILSVDTR